jgi:Chemoreceptor zinc-binding domain
MLKIILYRLSYVMNTLRTSRNMPIQEKEHSYEKRSNYLMNPPSTVVIAINAALKTHATWEHRLQEYLDDTISLNPQQVGQNNICAFGKWLESDGKDHLIPADYASLNKLHTQFHRVAAAIVQLKKAGNLEQAHEGLKSGGEFPKISAELSESLTAIRNKTMDLLHQQHPSALD